MNTTKQSKFASRLAILVLAVLAIAGLQSCSKEDSIDNYLSDKTTPVTFELIKGMHFMYDYSGSIYVKGDTINVLKNGEVKRDMRQGKHFIVWLKEKSFDDNKLYEVHYDAQQKKLVRNGNYPVLNHDVQYAISEVNVSEYLLPTQTFEYSSIMARLDIVATDYDIYQGINSPSGVVKGFPNIPSVSLMDDSYELGDPGEVPIFYDTNIKMLYTNGIYLMLCPKNGLDNIQLSVEIKDANGQIINTTPLPKCSFRRGHTTALAGPLFSGSTSDWEVNVYKK